MAAAFESSWALAASAASWVMRVLKAPMISGEVRWTVWWEFFGDSLNTTTLLHSMWKVTSPLTRPPPTTLWAVSMSWRMRSRQGMGAGETMERDGAVRREDGRPHPPAADHLLPPQGQ